MNFVEELSAVALLVDFLLGVAFGVVGGAAYGSVREDREHTMLGPAPGPLSAGARKVLHVHTSSDEYMRSLLARGGEEITAGGRGNHPSGTESQESRR